MNLYKSQRQIVVPVNAVKHAGGQGNLLIISIQIHMYVHTHTHLHLHK